MGEDKMDNLQILIEFVNMWNSGKVNLKVYDKAAVAARELGLSSNVAEIFDYVETKKEK